MAFWFTTNYNQTMISLIKKLLKKIADRLNANARKNRGLYLKENIEQDYPNIKIRELTMIEDLTVTQKELDGLKNLITNDRYAYPFDKGITGPVEATRFLMLLQILNDDGKKYAVIFDLQAGYDMIRGEPTLWIGEISKDLVSPDQVTEVYHF